MPFSWVVDEDKFSAALGEIQMELRRPEDAFSDSDWAKVMSRYTENGGRIRKEPALDKDGEVKNGGKRTEQIAENLQKGGRPEAAAAVRFSGVEVPKYSLTSGAPPVMDSVLAEGAAPPTDQVLNSMKASMQAMLKQAKPVVNRLANSETKNAPTQPLEEDRTERFIREIKGERATTEHTGEDRSNIQTNSTTDIRQLVEAVVGGADVYDVARQLLGVGGTNEHRQDQGAGRQSRSRRRS